MAPCCPPGRGCNAPGGDEPCALALCSAAADEEPDAALVLTRWEELQRVQERGGERRFRRRAFERARDQALQALAMRLKPSTVRTRTAPNAGGRIRRPQTRLGRRVIV